MYGAMWNVLLPFARADCICYFDICFADKNKRLGNYMWIKWGKVHRIFCLRSSYSRGKFVIVVDVFALQLRALNGTRFYVSFNVNGFLLITLKMMAIRKN